MSRWRKPARVVAPGCRLAGLAGLFLLLGGLLSACSPPPSGVSPFSWGRPSPSLPTLGEATAPPKTSLAFTPSPSRPLAARPTPSSRPTPVPSPRPTATLRPDGARRLLEQGDALLADGDYEGALAFYEELRAASPGTAAADQALLRIAQVYLEMGRPISVTALLSSTLDLLPPEPRHRASFLLAEAYRQAGDCLRAVPFYVLYREGGTTLEDLIAERLAGCHRALGNRAAAAEEFTRAASPYRSLSEQVGMLEEAATDLRAIADYDGALERYERILDLARKPWYRATILYAMGQALLEAGRPEEARARWQEALTSYPDTEEASWSADALLAAGAEVDPYAAARAYRAAGRLDEALSWFDEAVGRGNYPIELRYRLAEARSAAGDLAGALAELDALAQENPSDPRPLMEQGQYLQDYGLFDRALEAYDRVQDTFPKTGAAGEALWRSGQLLEEQGRDGEAIAAYTALMERFPTHERATEARFLAGLLCYRWGNYSEAAALWDGETRRETARAALWRGLALERQGLTEEARRSWEKAGLETGYYAARARELLSSAPGFGDFHGVPGKGEEAMEQAEAEAWLAAAFGRPVSAELPAEVRADPLFLRGEELLALGRAEEARRPFSILVERFRYDRPALYALALYLRQSHLHGLSIQCAARLIQATVDREEDAPYFLLRLAYPIPYAHLIVPRARAEGLDPLVFLALVRQESLFDRYATSWAEARGLTQVIPSTGEGIAAALGFSPFRLEDLYRPVVSVRFGTWYLGRQLESFAGQTVLALSAYNGGPGNASRWAGGQIPVADVDLFVETIDFAETRDYVERIYTSYWMYRRLYAGTLQGPAR